MYDPKKVADLAHKHGALMLLDAYQSVGSLPVDVKELDVDFLAAGALKYLLASAGLGFFYCRRELWERAWPTATGWFADQDIFKMDASRYAPSRPRGASSRVPRRSRRSTPASRASS